MYDVYQARIDERNDQIERALAVLSADRSLSDQSISKARARAKQPNAVNFDVRLNSDSHCMKLSVILKGGGRRVYFAKGAR